MKKLLITAGCALIAAGPAMAQDTAAQAAADSYDRALVVTYDDLDLSSKRDQRRLKNRLDKAARVACGYQEIRTGTRGKDSDALRCYREAKASNRGTFDAVMESYAKGG